MSKTDFKKIVDSLKCGREIEFSYHNKLYSITTSHGDWNFCCGDELIERVCAFDDKEALVERISSFYIDGTPLPSVFDDELYDEASVCIL